MWAMGMTMPSGRFESPEDVERHQREHLNMLSVMLSGVLDSVYRVVPTGFLIPDVMDAVDAANEELLKEPWRQSTAT
jgi:hypothetical protein